MLSKRAEEEILQSEKEMKILLESLRLRIEVLKKNMIILRSSSNKADDYKAVLVDLEILRTETLLQETISVFRREETLFHITNNVLYGAEQSVKSLFLEEFENDIDPTTLTTSESEESDSD